MPQMIVASRLHDGLVVFLTPTEQWTESIEAGAVIDAPADAERLLAVAKAHEERSIVVEPYLIDVAVEENKPRPAAIREVIRAFGPTVRTDLDRYD